MAIYFEPIDLHGDCPRYSIALELENACRLPRRKNASAADGRRRSLRGLHARATVECALRATGLASVYELTKAYGRGSFDPADGVTLSQWAESRSKLYDAWRAGNSFVVSKAWRPSAAAVDFLTSLGEAAPEVLAIVNSSMWRLLSPDPVPLSLLISTSQASDPRFERPSRLKAWSYPAIWEYGKQVIELMQNPRTRLNALESLWFTMRSARELEQLPRYVLAYNIWLCVFRVLKEDPIFGRLATDLYAYTSRHFGQVAVFPADRASMRRACALLRTTNLHPTVMDDPYLWVVLEWNLGPLLKSSEPYTPIWL